MKVLIIGTDIFDAVGGGQTVYRQIIEKSPEIEFHYFRNLERYDAPRPANAKVISLFGRRNLKVLAPPPFANYKLPPLEQADQFARSVAGQHYDIVDCPDFYTIGSLLRASFDHHNVRVGRIILALHGNISKSMELNWGSTGNDVLESQMLERDQVEALDGLYAISPRYIKEWQAKVNRPISFIDPLNFLPTTVEVLPFNSENDKPSLYCIGRSERRKGNDIFIELVSWLQKGSFDRAAHIGDQDYSFHGVGSEYLLRNIARQRQVEIDYLPAMSMQELRGVYSKSSIVVLPVRYDTFNLVAIEALFSGCPVAISSRAGVCDYLDVRYPGLPYIKIDVDNIYGAVAVLQDLVDNYESHRARLYDYLSKISYTPEALNIHQIYESVYSGSCGGKNLNELPYKEQRLTLKGYVVNLVRKTLPKNSYRSFRRIINAPRAYLKETLRNSGYFGDAKFLEALHDAKSVPFRLLKIARHSEYNFDRLREKLSEIYGISTNPLYRCNFWLDIARIERVRGNELIAVTYELRVLRLLGRDRLGLLPRVMDTLNKNGFKYEAQVADAMYGDSKTAENNVYEFLKDAYERNLKYAPKPFELVDDRRDKNDVKVSVIVSLYKAADKLAFFLTALAQQTLLKKGLVEVILVDSGSPTDEYAVFVKLMATMPFNVLYLRSKDRETIQAAWNRGIVLAKAPYLVFLGVDETLYPEGLEVLADELDENPDVDWIMANSLVTAVEENGLYKHDIMPYDRAGATKGHVYLETCYLSWVGGMYRKSLHDRFGYYDESFSAAGDTEIKNRILPHINVKFISRMLGLFLNYPDGQTTASPKAEIEDLRAWYVHRTPGGVRYAYENRSSEEIEKQICTALGYRKSYCGHMSCDIEYARYLTGFLRSRNSHSKILSIEEGLAVMLDQLRELEFTDMPPGFMQGMNKLFKAWRSAMNYQSVHRYELKSIAWPVYSVLNDNRYEQHSWLWKSS